MRRRLRQAWDDPERGRALGRLEQLATELSHSHPGAAASLREGMAETLTLTRLRISGPLTRTLASTNPIWVFDLTGQWRFAVAAGTSRARLSEAGLRDALPEPGREGFVCGPCGRFIVTAICGLYRARARGSARRYCSASCR